MARLTALLVLLALAVPGGRSGASPPPLRPKTANGPLGDETLSNETTLSRWAYTNLARKVRVEAGQPRTLVHPPALGHGGRPAGGLPRARLDARRAGQAVAEDPRARPPQRSHGLRARAALSPLRIVETQLVVDRKRLRATLYKRGRVIWRSPIGVGAPGTVTPAGRFWIRERLRNLGGSPVYGPWAFGTAAYSDTLTDWPGGGVVGIHGTNEPQLIPGRPSHGCVRVPNRRISRLARLMPIGTPLRIK